MTLPIYPASNLLPGLTYSSKWTPTFFAQTAVSPTGAEYDIAVAQYPLHDFELTYEFLRDGPGWGNALSALELRTLMGFHLMMAGSVGRFLYRNPDDNIVFRNRIGTGDGVTRSFLITRTFGANGYDAAEPVGMIDTSAPLAVYLGDEYAPVDPTLYEIGTSVPVANTITFATAPAVGTEISLDMSYFYYCKLVANAATFEKFMTRLWSIGKVQLRSCRAGA